jgi:DNA-binding CsgD family transcriptional regulator
MQKNANPNPILWQNSSYQKSFCMAQDQSKTLLSLSSPLFNTVAMRALICIKIMPGNKFIALSTHSQWLEAIYKDYAHTLSKTVWGASAKVSKLNYYAQPWSHQEKSWKTMMIHLSLEHGINLWKREDDCVYLFGFYGFARKDYSRCVIQSIDNLKIFSNHFVKRASSLISNMEKYSCHLPNQSKKIFPEAYDPFQQFIDITPIQYFPIIKEGESYKITYKQAQCVQGMSEGKCAKMIAKEMGLSPRTIEKHIEKIKLSLSIRHTHEIISIYKKSRERWV